MSLLLDYFRENGLVFELWVAILAFLWRAPRRPNAPLRFATCFALTVGGWALWTYFTPDSIWAQMIGFVILVAACLWSIWFCWQFSVTSAVFYGVSAAVLQHLAFRGARAVVLGTELTFGVNAQTTEFLYVAALVPFIVAGYYLFARPLAGRPVGRIGSTSVVMLAAGMLVFVHLFTRLFEQAGGERLPRIDLIYSLFDLITCIFVLALMTQIASRLWAESESQVLQRLLHQQKRQLETSRETNELISIKTHDLKKQIGLLENRISSREIEELKSLVDAYESSAGTGNEAVDILIGEKSVSCNERDIRFDRMIAGAALNFMSAADTYALLGNAIDNSVEAVAALDKESRYINMRVQRSKGFVLIELVNPFEGTRIFVEGLPQSTKGDRRYHGFGMRSIRMVADKYDGHMSAEAKDGLFILRVLFPEPDPGTN